MVYSEPYTPDRAYLKCNECGYRECVDEMPGCCPKCNGNVRNLAVSRW